MQWDFAFHCPLQPVLRLWSVNARSLSLGPAHPTRSRQVLNPDALCIGPSLQLYPTFTHLSTRVCAQSLRRTGQGDGWQVDGQGC